MARARVCSAERYFPKHLLTVLCDATLVAGTGTGTDTVPRYLLAPFLQQYFWDVSTEARRLCIWFFYWAEFFRVAVSGEDRPRETKPVLHLAVCRQNRPRARREKHNTVKAISVASRVERRAGAAEFA